MFDGFVLLAVRRDGLQLTVLNVLAIEADCDRRSVNATASMQGVSEWHVHLLADGCNQRRAVGLDLRAIHERTAAAALSA